MLHPAAEVVVSALLDSERYGGPVAVVSLSNGDEKNAKKV
jgi:hypothetical protein